MMLYLISGDAGLSPVLICQVTSKGNSGLERYDLNYATGFIPLTKRVVYLVMAVIVRARKNAEAFSFFANAYSTLLYFREIHFP